MSWSQDWFFAHAGMFVIPAEHLSRDGLSDELEELLEERTALGEGWRRLFTEAFREYWRRTQELAAKAPMYWFPPRVQNVCIVTEPARVRPYFQPFFKSSWLLYASDFDPETSNVELGVFQLLQAERIGLMQQVLPVLGCNLSYWLTVGDDEVRLFREACATSTRPDAEAFRALAEALPWIRELRHEILRPPVVALPEPTVTVPGTGLLIPASRRSDVGRLAGTWKRVVESVAGAHLARHAVRERNHAEEVCAWLRDEAPRVIVSGPQGRVLWAPDRPDDLKAVRIELKGISRSAAERVRGDLEVAAAHTQSFVESMRFPEDLPQPDPRFADQDGLTYMHVDRREIAYNLAEPGMQRTVEGAPPYERFMLGARTIHEWGHLATEAGWVPVAEARRAEHESLLTETSELFDEIVAEAPAAVRGACAKSVAETAKGQPSAGAGLAHFSIARIEDYQSNLLSQRYLTREEAETYVRNNVRSLVHDYTREGFFHRLARYAYEFQYLRFSAVEDEREYFLRTTWFEEQYLQPGIVSEERFDRLLELLGGLCGTYEVDESRFRAPRSARSDAPRTP